MTYDNKVVWQEGMFLQPQHFQQHDRYLEHYVQQKHRALNQHDWGFLAMELDIELLAVGKVGILTASGIFPDGTPFDIPRNESVPPPFEVPEGMNDTMLYLALPLRRNGATEAGTDEADVIYRNHIVTAKVINAIAGSQESSDIRLGALACRIISAQDDLSQYSYLPLTRIKESRSNYQISLDEHFLTTWLNVHQSPMLKQFVSEVHTLLEHRSKMLAGRLTDTQQASTVEVSDFLLLQLTNRYELIFNYLMQKVLLHPERLYCVLLELLGEVATHVNNQRRPAELPTYQHGNLLATFQPIIKETKRMLSIVLEQNASAIPLEVRDHGLWVGVVHDKTLLSSCDFILSVYADAPTENVRAFLPSRIKIAPVESIGNLVRRALPAIPIEPVAIAPRQIPYYANFCYFSVDKTHPLWAELENSAGIGIHVSSVIPNLKLELWAIKG